MKHLLYLTLLFVFLLNIHMALLHQLMRCQYMELFLNNICKKIIEIFHLDQELVHVPYGTR